MSHTPLGYRIENGKAVIDNKAAEQIKTSLSILSIGHPLATAAKKAGIKSFHASIGRMLRNARYLVMNITRQLLTRIRLRQPKRSVLSGLRNLAASVNQKKKLQWASPLPST